MTKIALHVEQLGKQYSIGSVKPKDFSLAQSLILAFKHPFSKLRDFHKNNRARNIQLFWALKNVSFSVKEGEVVGIIGSNGSGKSTLLKIISRVVEPTTGKIELYGRIGSLLEIGMGFHPELTGRENIYLNGSILGMKKAEIDLSLDEIITFSNLEKFIDTPVKRYSSGMYVRLAFSIAAQLNPEILLLDEVLAVGDQAFQGKCLQRMNSIAQDGRTVLFVSHSMTSIRQLCDRAILLSEGSLIADGPVDQVVDRYLGIVYESGREGISIENVEDIDFFVQKLSPDKAFRLNNIEILQNDALTLTVGNGRPIKVHIEYSVLQETTGLFVFFRLYNSSGTLIFESLNNGDLEQLPVVSKADYVSTATIPADFLLPERHELLIGAAIYNDRVCISEPIRLTLNVNRDGIVNRAYGNRRIIGDIAPLIEWENCTNLLEKPATVSVRIDSDSKQEVSFVEQLGKKAQILGYRILNSGGGTTGTFSCDEPVTMEMRLIIRDPIPELYGYLQIDKVGHEACLVSDSWDAGSNRLDDLAAGQYLINVTLPPRLLAPGSYSVYLNFTSQRHPGFNVDSPGTLCYFQMIDDRTWRGNNRPGCHGTLLEWKLTSIL